MSTAKDEAEIGRTKLQRYDEDGSERPEEEEEEEERDEDGTPINLSGPARLEFADQRRDENNLSTESGHSRILNGHGSTVLKNSYSESSPNVGRPSSADGSLSIPDDTPSIQVKICC